MNVYEQAARGLYHTSAEVHYTLPQQEEPNYSAASSNSHIDAYDEQDIVSVNVLNISYHS